MLTFTIPAGTPPVLIYNCAWRNCGHSKNAAGWKAAAIFIYTHIFLSFINFEVEIFSGIFSPLYTFICLWSIFYICTHIFVAGAEKLRTLFRGIHHFQLGDFSGNNNFPVPRLGWLFLICLLWKCRFRHTKIEKKISQHFLRRNLLYFGFSLSPKIIIF